MPHLPNSEQNKLGRAETEHSAKIPRNKCFVFSSPRLVRNLPFRQHDPGRDPELGGGRLRGGATPGTSEEIVMAASLGEAATLLRTESYLAVVLDQYLL